MPLNINDAEERKNPAGGETPFAQAPLQGAAGGKRRILLWIFLAVVLVSVFFLLLEFGVIPAGGKRGGGTHPGGDSGNAAPPAAEAPVESTGTATERDRAAELRDRLSKFGGGYTIFISALRDSADAGELAGRWERAGYQTLILHSSGWYRVGLGRYDTPALARADAEKLRQALEEGYWIGRTTL